jgi:hypothetical protein
VKRLTLVLVAVAVAGCGSTATKPVTVDRTSSTANSAVPGSSQTQTVEVVQGGDASEHVPTVHLATFKSPSGNIGCTIIGGGARCDIRQRSWSPPPRPASCPNEVDFGQGLNVGRHGRGRLVCAGDTAMDPRAPALRYGTDTLVGRFRCASRTSGMTCTNIRTRHGFFISIQRYRAF